MAGRRCSAAAYLASAEHRRREGRFPLFDRDALSRRRDMRPARRRARRRSPHGIRNALLTSIAPTGTISLFADNVSSGIEPVFSFSLHAQRADAPDGAREERSRIMPTALLALFKGDERAAARFFVDAQTLTPAEHLVMQAAVQACRQLDLQDHQLPATSPSRPSRTSTRRPMRGLQGLHDLPAERRDRRGAETVPKRSGAPVKPQLPLPAKNCRVAGSRRVAEAGGVVYMTQPLDRPRRCRASTYKMRWPDSDHAIYITINDIDAGRPPPAVRDLHQLEEHGALRLDGGADPHDLGGVPPRRRRLVRGRGAEGGVRSARRRSGWKAATCPRCWPRSAA
jgi:ribonucleoside-diphosphate reductase alpha chain